MPGRRIPYDAPVVVDVVRAVSCEYVQQLLIVCFAPVLLLGRWTLGQPVAIIVALENEAGASAEAVHSSAPRRWLAVVVVVVVLFIRVQGAVLFLLRAVYVLYALLVVLACVVCVPAGQLDSWLRFESLHCNGLVLW